PSGGEEPCVIHGKAPGHSRVGINAAIQLDRVEPGTESRNEVGIGRTGRHRENHDRTGPTGQRVISRPTVERVEPAGRATGAAEGIVAITTHQAVGHGTAAEGVVAAKALQLVAIPHEVVEVVADTCKSALRKSVADE